MTAVYFGHSALREDAQVGVLRSTAPRRMRYALIGCANVQIGDTDGEVLCRLEQEEHRSRVGSSKVESTAAP